MKKLLGILIILCFPLVGLALRTDDPVIARIGDKEIMQSDFDRWISFNSAPAQKEIKENNKKKVTMLNQIVTAWVVADIARKEKFDKREDIREKMQLLINNFLTLEYLDKAVASRVKASEKEIRRYYKENKEKFRTKESLRARHILIRIDKTAPEGDRQAARKKAASILEQIKGGADFSALASRYSDDAGTKNKGGDLGFFGRGRMEPAFEEVAFNLEPGDVSGIVQTSYGYHIIKVEARRDASVKLLSDVRPMIEKKLTLDKRREAIDRYVSKAMKDAHAEIDVGALVGNDPHFAK